MLGFILGALGAGYICKCLAEGAESDARIQAQREYRNRMNRLKSENDDLRYQNSRLRYQNERLRVTIYNHQRLLGTFDKINKFAKAIGYKGAVPFFYDLADYHDSRFASLARFLYKVKCIRNEVAHEGTIYEIDDRFLDKLQACWDICNYYRNLPPNARLLLPYNRR